MKKFISLIGILTVCSALFSCKDVSDVEDQKLDVSAKSEGNVIAIPYVENLTYLNVFRTDSAGETYNIGLIKPLKKVMSSYIFTDELVNTGDSYQYYVRYNIKGVYKYSGVSGAVTAAGTSLTEKEINVGTEHLNFNPTDMTLTPSGTISGETGYHIVLAISLADGIAATTYPVTADDGDLSSSITLPSILTLSYMNKPIALKGLLLEKSEDSDDDIYRTISWSKPAVIEVLSTEDGSDVTDAFIVTNGTSSGGEYDYYGRTLTSKPETVTTDYKN